MSSLEGRNVLVVAQGDACAGALVWTLAAAGARVLHTGDAGSPRVRALQQALDASGLSGRVGVMPLPARDEEGLDSLFTAAAERLDQIHVVVSSHGTSFAACAPLHELELAVWRRGLDAGLRTPFLVARRAMEEFLGAGGGRLVQVCRVGTGAGALAVASALEGFTRSVSKEYGKRGIACNSVIVQSGEVDTGRLREADPRSEVFTPLGHAVQFLASDDASFVNGETLQVQECLS